MHKLSEGSFWLVLKLKCNRCLLSLSGNKIELMKNIYTYIYSHLFCIIRLTLAIAESYKCIKNFMKMNDRRGRILLDFFFSVASKGCKIQDLNDRSKFMTYSRSQVEEYSCTKII